jgi:hypothetical protein
MTQNTAKLCQRILTGPQHIRIEVPSQCGRIDPQKRFMWDPSADGCTEKLEHVQSQLQTPCTHLDRGPIGHVDESMLHRPA